MYCLRGANYSVCQGHIVIYAAAFHCICASTILLCMNSIEDSASICRAT